MPTQCERLKSCIWERPGQTEIELARALHGPGAIQQRVNADCRSLVLAGVIKREGAGGTSDPFRYYPPLAVPNGKPHENSVALLPRSNFSAFQASEKLDAPTDWFWEGKVVEAIVVFLRRDGWNIEVTADTLSKERGPDVHATKNGLELFVEAKGFPSKGYRDPRRAGERKPTNPTNQAQHWYSHAVLKAMRLQNKHPEAIVILGLPDFPRYRQLFDETKSGLERLGLGLLIVNKSGDIEAWGSILVHLR